MAKKPNLLNLAAQLQTEPQAQPQAAAQTLLELPPGDVDPNPEWGERGDFLKITVTMSPEQLAELKLLGLRRRARGIPDTGTSALIREAVAQLIKRGE